MQLSLLRGKFLLEAGTGDFTLSARQAFQAALGFAPGKCCRAKATKALAQLAFSEQQTAPGKASGDEGPLDQPTWQDVQAQQEPGSLPVPELESGSQTGRLSHTPNIYEDNQHSITNYDIPKSAWLVLLQLRAAGHEGYVVGGAIRDLLLQRRPKDFDIITSATVIQVKKLIYNSRLVGRRFPIVQVIKDKMQIEISSFATGALPSDLPIDAAAVLERFRNGAKKEKLMDVISQGTLWSAARKSNALARDFTVNALFYDPFSGNLYDYTGGVKDCRRKVLRSIMDAEKSFTQDPARMLRAIRLAARSGLKIEKKTADVMKKCFPLIADLHSGRVMMEAQALMGYGSAEQTVRLLWQYRLLDFMMPVLATYMKQKAVSRMKGEGEVFQMLARLDRLATPERPLPPIVWQACLVAHITNHRAELAGYTPPSPSIEPFTGVKVEGVEEEEKQAGTSEDEDHDHESVEESEAVLQEEVQEEGLEEGDLNPKGSPSKDQPDNTYLKIARQVTSELIGSPTVGVVAKGVLPQVMKVITLLHDRTCGVNQTRLTICGKCKTRHIIYMDFKGWPRCKRCQYQLPQKPLKEARSPELQALLRVVGGKF